VSPGNITDDVAGGSGRHIPVMLNEVLDCLRPLSAKRVVDGTFGAGGYTTAFLNEGACVFSIDRDPDAVKGGQHLADSYKDRLRLVAGEFAELDRLCTEDAFDQVDGVVLDIGVSSMQLDEAERGFSFRQDGPLDMRMSQSGVSAADVVNQAAQPDLTRIIGLLGEEKKASLISREIVNQRQKASIQTTRELASTIEQVVHRRATDKIHPATRTFQALRIFVNRELEQLCNALFAAERVLREGGRLVLVTFHSLEDRIVKQFFRDRGEVARGSRHMPILEAEPTTFELEGNGLVKPSAVFGLPTLASLSGFSTVEAC